MGGSLINAENQIIFLVDDDLTNLEMGKLALEEYYTILTFDSGAKLLHILEKITPNLILLDVEMPHLNGYDLISLIKADEVTKNIPIIFLTGKSNLEDELKGLSLGAVDYITKPFSPPLLLKRIELHILVEAQKQELINFNTSLQKIVDEKTKTVTELQNAILRTMSELVEYRDNETGNHIERTQKYLSILLKKTVQMGVYTEETSNLDLELAIQSAQLHDVGKIAIGDNILLKPGKLTPEEFEKIKTHTTFGARIIDRIKESTTQHAFLELARILALTHHEKWNGTGYPFGLKGEDIHILGRIMAIADVYDAIVSERPYKKAFSHEEAVEIIKKDSGSHFDPKLVEVFLLVEGKFKTISQEMTN